MENSKNLLKIFRKRNFIILNIILTIVITIPILIYAINFWGDWQFSTGIWSKDRAVWGVFGDFIGGTLNTILNFIILLFSMINMYLSITLTLKVHEDTQNLQKRQVIPYSLISTVYDSSNFKFEIKNAGLGPLIVKSIKCSNNGNTKKYIHELLPGELIEETKSFTTYFEFTKLVISPNETIELFGIRPSEIYPELNFKLSKYIDNFRSILDNTKIELEYTDIYGNQYPVDWVTFSNTKK